jgi:ATP-dependent Clp protease ATP-binding subunit ClpA
MFERFTDRARQVVVLAQERSRERAAGEIRTEHLLLGLLGVPDNLALTVLEAHSVDPADVVRGVDRLGAYGASDAESLAVLGIDLEEVRRQVEGAFGPGALDNTRAARSRDRRRSGHIPFERAAKKALELSLREALRMGHDYIGCEHLLLGLLHDGGAARVLRELGVDQHASRVIVEELVRKRKAG